MGLDLLVVSLVRETATLIAAAATHRGKRTSLAGLSDQLFYSLATELHGLKVRRRVAADMLGLVLRAYQRKVRRMETSATDRGRCLWEVVYAFIAERGPVHRAAIKARFHRDDLEALRGVLSDLRESGIIWVTGRGDEAIFRTATGPEREARFQDAVTLTDDLVWTLIYHDGPVTRAAIERHGVKPLELNHALTTLLLAGRIREERDPTGESVFRTLDSSAPAPVGHEAAVLDHFHAVTRTLSSILLRPGGSAATSTYRFDLWPGHPLGEEARSLFRAWRSQASDLLARVEAHNASCTAIPAIEPLVLYVGGCKEAPRRHVPEPAVADSDAAMVHTSG